MRRTGEIREPALVLIFGIITCGFYHLWWMYQTSEDIQSFLGEPDISPGMEILLMVVTCYIYAVYWDYKYCRKIAQMRSIVGLNPDDQSILCLILKILGMGVVASLIEQTHLNEVWRRSGSSVRP
ncbi:MAG: DUF4234 domain-containing protein [Armatimonadota bacterium]